MWPQSERRICKVLMCATCLVAVCVPFFSYCPISPMGRDVELVLPGEKRVSGDFEELPLDDKSERDSVVLKNGDSLSGEVVKIQEGEVHLAAEMVEGTVRIPLGSLKGLTLKKRTPTEKEAKDRITLSEGGSFVAMVGRTDGDKLLFRTGTGQGWPEMAVRMSDVASLALGVEPLVLLETDFTNEENVPFVGQEGEWVISRGRFFQCDSGQHGATAHARVSQWGRLRYSWTLDMPDWGRAGVYLLASNPSVVERGSSYLVQLEHGRLTVVRTSERGATSAFSCSTASVMPRAKFKFECDCQTGEINVWLNGKEMARFRDYRPVTSGEYLILRADGRAAFDDVRVEQVSGEPGPWEDGVTDLVVLKNGDRIAGRVKEISEKEVVVIDQDAAREAKAERGKVMRVTFGGRRTQPTKAPWIAFSSGDRLSGEVASMDERVLLVENETIGTLRFDVGLVKGIVVEE